ncbi:AAA family ATPase, partial [Acinetobacter oleivorans]|uniref:AAA family ATPase n=1 Tax=Acinetobacter oleivorans TaxID=1148157 RepID=UPI001580663C
IKGLQVNSILKGKSPNSNLESTKTLTRDDEFVQVIVTNMQQLEALCNWWDELNESNQDSSEASKLEVSQMEEIAQPLNRILFGAAGTGKTFNTINHALSIIEDKSLEELEKEERKDLKNRFDEYKNKGQIKFVTFHQSFSYEDFVEGIRAETVEYSDGKKNIEYPVVSGVFKLLCDTAQSKVILESQKINFDSNTNEIWKMSLGRAGEDEDIFDYCIKNHCVLLGWGDELDFSNAVNRKQIEEIMDKNGYEAYRKEYPSASRFVNDFKNKTKVGDLIIISDGNHKFRAIGEINGNYELLTDSEDAPRYVQKKSVKWLKLFKPSLNVEQLFDKVLSQQTIYNLANSINISKLKNLLDSHQKEDNDKKFVLIIDEINRGNISRIFGELITLIEDSKRQGAEESLSIILPYSKKPFSVPKNLYLIGTMNSSDRSLTGLDIALRRRFTFIEMPPRPELLDNLEIDGVNIQELLTVINQRIEILLDRDHCIGHANFMSLNSQSTIDELAQIFKQKVIPQLQEYFFDDWARINLVLNGNGMLKPKPMETSAIFPNVDSEELGYFEDKKIWELVPTSFNSIESFKKIIQY